MYINETNIKVGQKYVYKNHPTKIRIFLLCVGDTHFYATLGEEAFFDIRDFPKTYGSENRKKLIISMKKTNVNFYDFHSNGFEICLLKVKNNKLNRKLYPDNEKDSEYIYL